MSLAPNTVVNTEPNKKVCPRVRDFPAMGIEKAFMLSSAVIAILDMEWVKFSFIHRLRWSLVEMEAIFESA